MYPNLPYKSAYYVTEAAHGIGMSRGFLYKQINAGFLAAMKYSHRRGIKIPAQALYDYIEAHIYDAYR